MGSKVLYTIYESGDVCTFKFKTTSMSSGYTDIPHSFDELKMVRVVSGKGIWRIGEVDHRVKAGDILIFSRIDRRSIQEVTSKEPLVIEQVVFLPIALYPWQSCADFFFERNSGVSNILPPCAETEKIRAGFDELRREIDGDAAFKDAAIVQILIGMVIAGARLFPGQKVLRDPIKDNQYQIVCRAMSYINANLASDLSRPTLAKMFWVSPSHFSRIFREYSGFCLQDYIVRSRVTNAVNLMRSKNVTVLEAALESGFTSSSGFYRAFHATTGKSPTDYLRANGQ